MDLQGVYRRLDIQKDLMQFACSISRSIDPRRLRKLTPEQTASVNDLLYILKLHKRVNDLSNAPVGSRKDDRLQNATKRLYNEKQRKRRELLKDVKERYKSEQPVKDSERQLSTCLTLLLGAGKMTGSRMPPSDCITRSSGSGENSSRTLRNGTSPSSR